MKEILCPMDELVEIDLDGYREGLEEAGETEAFDLNGKAVE